MPRLPDSSAVSPAQLRARRRALRLSQQQLADGLGISRSQLHNYERGYDRHTGKPCPVPRIVAIDLAEIERLVSAAAE